MIFQLNDLVALHDIIQFVAVNLKQTECKLLLKKWSILKEIVRILKIPYTATVKLQNSELILSEAYAIWVIMKLHLESIIQKGSTQTGLDKKLLNALNNRQAAVVNNPAMKAALYLDPRFHAYMKNSMEFESAKREICDIWRRLNVISSKNVNETNQNISTDSDDHFDASSAWDKYIGLPSSTNRHVECDIELIVDIFDPPQMNINQSPIDFWESRKEQDSELYKIAMVVFAISATEVEIERDFSKLAHIFSHHRYQLSQNTLQNILLLNLNSDIYRMINEEDLKELEQ